MAVLFVFPGQGAQRTGMIDALPDSAPVRDTLDEASDTLGEDVAALNDAQTLADTRAVQIALTVVGVAAARHLASEAAGPDAVLGLSIGAWPAAVVAGALAFSSALTLVAERGRLMSQAYPSGYGMAAILGLPRERVEALVDDIRAEMTPNALFVANINSDQQIVVAGADAALDEIAQRAPKRGARRVQRLDIAVPSHCKLMDEPAQALAAASRQTLFAAPRIAYFSANRKRRLWTSDDLRDDLIHNMARVVYWADTIRIADESDLALALEMPPGETLTRLYPGAARGRAAAVARIGWQDATSLIGRHR